MVEIGDQDGMVRGEIQGLSASSAHVRAQDHQGSDEGVNVRYTPSAAVVLEVGHVDLEEVTCCCVQLYILEQGADRSREPPALVLLTAISMNDRMAGMGHAVSLAINWARQSSSARATALRYDP